MAKQLKHIVLDIDQTLCTNYYKGGIAKFIPRPYLKNFLQFLFAEFETVSIFTAACSGHMNSFLEFVKKKFMPSGAKFLVTLSRKNCEYIEKDGRCYIAKKLITFIEKVDEVDEDIDPCWDTTLLIDDDSDSFFCDKNNGILIKEFTLSSQKDDDCLLKVAYRLWQIKTKSLNFYKEENRKIDWEKKVQIPEEFKKLFFF